MQFRRDESEKIITMLDDLFEEIDVSSGKPSARSQILARLFFGSLGVFLGLAGCYHFAVDTEFTGNVMLRASIILLFAALTAFCLFNIMFARPWRWPGKLFIASFIAMFVTRILWGA